MNGMQQQLRKPSKSDPSRAKQVDDYGYKKGFYQSDVVAEDYDFHRWGTPSKARRNESKWRTILKALSIASDVKTILDLPCGTGRFTDRLAAQGYEVIGGDISVEMMQYAKNRIGAMENLLG